MKLTCAELFVNAASINGLVIKDYSVAAEVTIIDGDIAIAHKYTAHVRIVSWFRSVYIFCDDSALASTKTEIYNSQVSFSAKK